MEPSEGRRIMPTIQELESLVESLKDNCKDREQLLAEIIERTAREARLLQIEIADLKHKLNIILELQEREGLKNV